MTLNRWLVRQTGASGAVHKVVRALAESGKTLSRRISRGVLGGDLDAFAGENSDGDAQKRLDMIADELFMAAVSGGEVRFYASEEQEDILELTPEGDLAIAIDPLDGSSNIDVNVSIGTIFSVFPTRLNALASFLRPGEEQVAAGYMVYGPQTTLVLTLGDGVAIFILDRVSDEFVLAGKAKVPETAAEYAVNASNARHWSKPIRAFINDCNLGAEGPQSKNMNMRWVASLVAETHRILMRGGVFLYPGDARTNYQNGRLRHVYECAPIAFLVEQAGGMATNGIDRLLSITPSELHGRTPFVFGSYDLVQRVATYHELPDSEISPLFSARGLFSN